MLWFLFAILFILWIIGVAGVFHIGGFAWLFLLAAAIIFIAQLARGGSKPRPAA